MSGSHAMPILLAEAGLWAALIPVGVVLLLFISFEVAMAVTISSLPRSRMQQRWTPQEQRRVLRVFCTVFAVWPMLGLVIGGHVFLPALFAYAIDAAVLVLIGLAVWWKLHAAGQHKLIAQGHCAHCLYDLRASRHSDHCPECGFALQQPQAPHAP